MFLKSPYRLKGIFFRYFILSFLCIVSTFLSAQLITQTFSYTGSMQSFTVPLLCLNTITIEARGASGGAVTVSCSASGGLGASMKGTFTATPGDVLSVLVGGVGMSNGHDAGGGGGSFVVASGNTPWLVAGGGGGATNNVGSCTSNRNGINASITTSGTSSGDFLVAGGTGGNGGGATSISSAGGGGGFYTSGTSPTSQNSGGRSYILGAAGGTASGTDSGGYGGGGSGGSQGGNGGGGGGYSGGGTSGANPKTGGGGGGSYNIGANQVNTAGVQSGNGIVIISYYAGPLITINASTTQICYGSSAILTASGAVSYTWSGGPQTASTNVTPTTTTIYTVSATDSNGCVGTSTLSVKVNTLPIVSVNSGSICSGNNFSIVPSGADTYTYSGGSSIVSPTATSVYSVSGTTTAGCVSSSAAISNVTVVPLPTVIVNGGAICFGKTFTIQPSGAVSYTYSSGSSTVAPIINSTYTVFGVNVQGCISPGAPISVTVNPLPTVSIVGSNQLCIGSSVEFTATGAQSYTWNGTTVGNTLSVSPTIATTYTLVGEDSNGCLNNAQKTITVNALPSLSVSGNSVICQGLSTNLLVSGSALSYTWSNSTVGNLITVSPSVSTVYIVQGTDINGCINTTVQPIMVNTLPPVTASADNSIICSGESVVLTGNGAVSYTWSGGISNATPFYPSSTSTYSLTGTGANSCKNTSTILIVVNPTPVLTLSPGISSSICFGESIEIGVSGANIYNWSNGDITPKITLSPTLTSQYSVTGTDANGCKATVQFNILVSECVGLFENNIAAPAKLFPNPNIGRFQIKLREPLPCGHLEIYDLQGKLIYMQPFISQIQEVNLDLSFKGMFIIHVFDGNKKVFTERINID